MAEEWQYKSKAQRDREFAERKYEQWESAQRRQEWTVKMWLKGMPQTQIAKHLGVSIGTVAKYIRKARDAGDLTEVQRPPKFD